MAQFDADIKLKVAVENLEASVRKVENAFKKVQDYRVKLKVDGQNELKSLGNSFKRLGQIVKTSGIVTAVAAITGSLQSLNNLPLIGGGLNTSALGNVVSQLGAFSNAAADAAASAPGLAAGIAASTAALVAFAPQIGRAVKDTLKIGKVAAEAQVPINKLLTIIGAATSSGALGGFGDAARGVEEYRRRLYELNESVSALRSRADKLKSTLNRFNSGSETAERIATKLVAVNARLNDELREQADLLRRVAGVNVTELEAAKGRKSIETGQKREQFLARQAQESERVQKSLLDLAKAQAEVDNARLNARAEQEQIRQEQMVRAANDETIKSLERRVQIEERIANVRSARASREANQRAQFLAGNPNQYEVGAFRPDSTLFQRQQATLKATQARLAANQENLKTNSANVFQLRQNLALLNQIAKIGKQIDQSTQNELKNQRRLNRELKVRKGREAQKNFAGRLESLALGVGFPLLFGGGAGSILGSAAGSFVGKQGFGGQIAGGAIGQTVDNAVASVIELGQALNPLTADVNKIIDAAGESGTELGKLITGLEDTKEAAKIASEVLATKIGQQGVDSLRKLGEETTELGSELAILGTKIASFVAGPLAAFIEKINEGLNSPQAKQIQALDVAKADFRAGKASPEITKLFEERSSLEGTQQERIARRLEIDKEIVEIINRQNQGIAEGIRLRAEGEVIAKNERDLEIQSEELIQLKKDAIAATGDERLRALAAVAEEEAKAGFLKEKQDLINRAIQGEISFRAVALVLQGKQVDLAATLAGIQERLGKSLARGAGGGGVDKEAQVQRTLLGLKTKSFELDTKLITIGDSKIGKLQVELQRLDQVQALKAAEINASKEDQRIKDAKLALLSKEYSLLYQQKELQLERLQIEERIADIKARQAGDNLQTQLDQELAGLTLPSGNSFLDEQNALQAEQANRYANVMRDVNDQIEIQRELATSTDKAISGAAEKRIIQLERQRDIYSTMLPQIAKAEREQLRFNQTLSLVEGPVNAFVNGLTEGLQGIIDGTMSAEEAFANMLKGMADALIQTAAQMIAQYIAIGIAKAFAGMGSPTNTFGSEGVQIQNDFGNFLSRCYFGSCQRRFRRSQQTLRRRRTRSRTLRPKQRRPHRQQRRQPCCPGPLHPQHLLQLQPAAEHHHRPRDADGQ